MKTSAREFLISKLPKDCIFEELQNIDNFPISEMAAIMQAYADHCEESAWISVKDSMPEKRLNAQNASDDLLLLNDGCQIEGWYSFKRNEWLTFINGMSVVLDCVTHWRPLPNPPKQ